VWQCHRKPFSGNKEFCVQTYSRDAVLVCMQIESKTFSVFRYLCSLSSSGICPSFTCLIFKLWMNITAQQVCFKYYANVKETVSYFYFLHTFFLSVLPDCLLEVNIYPEDPATNIDKNMYLVYFCL
jgi:hypothetical protein